MSRAMWVYKDRAGEDIGPIPSSAIYNLYLRGKLPANTILRREDEKSFRSRVEYTILHKDIPFVTPGVVEEGLENMKVVFTSMKQLCDRASEEDKDRQGSHTTSTSSDSVIPPFRRARDSVHRGSEVTTRETRVSLDDEDISESQSSQVKSRSFKCKHCDKTYAGRVGLWKHITTIHLKRRFPCKKCGKVYHHKDSLNRHVDSVHRGIRFKCSKCGKKFTQQCSLDQHKKFRVCKKPIVK